MEPPRKKETRSPQKQLKKKRGGRDVRGLPQLEGPVKNRKKQSEMETFVSGLYNLEEQRA